MAITTTLTQSSTIVGSVSQGNQPQVVRVTVPGPKGDTGASGSSQNELSGASDVDVTTFGLNDGAILQYRASSQKWTARNELDTTTGTFTLNGGSF
jgi:hypothetical protein